MRMCAFAAIAVLLLTVTVFPQKKPTAAAEAAWSAFIAQFISAVNSKSHSRIKGLMASERDFFSGGGGENRNEWMKLMTERRAWPEIARSVRGGTRRDPGNSSQWPARVTNDNTICFGYIRGRWRFTGPMGD